MKILLASQIAPEAADLLSGDHEVVPGFSIDTPVADQVVGCHGLVFRSGVEIDRAVLAAGADLSLIVRAGSGLDNVDIEAARERGIRIARVPGASPEAVAELTLGLLLAATRHISRADRLIRAGSWPKRELAGQLLADKTMGIVGAGRIGSRTGALCAMLGMKVLGCVESPSPDREAELAGLGIKLTDFTAVVSNSDFVSVHAQLQTSTHHLIDEEAIGMMKAGAVLINTSRGAVVDERAVYNALACGNLSAAAFDVHENEGDGVIPHLADLPNVVLTPHIGGMAVETQRAIGFRVVEIIAAFAAGRLDEVLAADERVV